MASKTLLAVWAHPDDESFGPAGVMCNAHEQGIHTVMVTATHGEAGNVGDPPLATQETLAQVRAAELRAACAVLGIDRLELWDYPDGKLQDVDPVLLRERIFALIEEVQPDVVLTFGPDGITGHPDHLVISDVTTQAFAQYIAIHSRSAPPRLYYVTPIPDEIPDESTRTTPLPLPPTTRIDVSGYAEQKRQALRAHATQRADWETRLINPEWFTTAYLHRAYPPLAANEPPETVIFA